MKYIFTLLTVLLIGSAGYAKDFPVAAFGATGDGTSDDGTAIQKAVDAAVAAGPGSRVIFETKTYRLDWRKSALHQIAHVKGFLRQHPVVADKHCDGNYFQQQG